MTRTLENLRIDFAPQISQEILITFAIATACLLALGAWRTRRVPLMRALTCAAFILFLAHPVLLTEKREPIKNTAVVIVDESASQNFENRAALRQSALEALQKTYADSYSIDLKIITAPEGGALASRTDLFDALSAAFADVPPAQRAGVVMLTDGQVHDAPDTEHFHSDFGPLHILLTGRRSEKDRRITLIEAPAFGIVGQNLNITFRIDDQINTQYASPAPDVRVQIKKPGATPEILLVKPGKDHSITLPVQHAGQNIFELSAEGMDGELTTANNHAVLEFQGVRDRLKVLLVSGRPHAGGRTWRDLLTGDPGVDLVHFTILRDPSKIDSTPPSDMSLIAFPFRELFEVKLYDFDLIIFDRYTHSDVLPDFYFENIERYIREGGAFLEASGPEYARKNSLYNTALRDLLPGAPRGQVIRQSFKPALTEKGATHPVTRDLNAGQPWGAWQRIVDLMPRTNTDVLMQGFEGRPLLLLERIDKGRVAQIASDDLWLWSRGMDGGGPYTELLRRVVHWLMKEPELDEQALDVQVNGRSIIIRRPAYLKQEETIQVTAPDGKTQTIALQKTENGAIEHTLTAQQLGLYEFTTADGESRFAIVGDTDPPELRNVLTSERILKPLSDASGGGVFWIAEDGLPNLRTVGARARASGSGWLGLRDNQSYTISGALEKSLVPQELAIALLITLALLTWWIEGRRR